MLLCRNLLEYALALRKAAHPLAAAAKRKTILALDSMAEEINTYGASNIREGLPLEALSVGLLAFGPNEASHGLRLWRFICYTAGRNPATL